LETDWSWRVDELRLLQNSFATVSEQKQGVTRKALVVMLYAHFEGHTKSALQTYVGVLNSQNLLVAQAHEALGAATLFEALSALRNPQSKCAYFPKLPEDSDVHRLARERHFVATTAELNTRRVVVSSNVVNTESNLKPIVLKKNLYLLGLEPDLVVKTWSGTIDKLLSLRNNTAHGSQREPISASQYEEVQRAVFTLVEDLRATLYDAAMNKVFLRSA